MLNPDFSDLDPAPRDSLDDPRTIIGHVSGLIRDTEAEKQQKANPFPVEVFPDPIQVIIAATNASLNFPVDFTAAAMLCAVSIATGITRKVEVTKGWQENAVLYIALVGRPGTNKSHPLSFALKPIEDRDSAKYGEYQLKRKQYDAAASLAKALAEPPNEGLAKPAWEQLLVTDFTPEALADVHRFNYRGLGVYSDELAGWFKNFGRYHKGSEEQFWLSVWSSKPIKINRKTGEPTYLQEPFISVCGTIQPGVLDELAQNRTENGFLDRLLFVVPDRLKKEYWSETEIDPAIGNNWNIIICNLLQLQVPTDENHNPQPQILRFTTEAKLLLFEWQRQFTDQSNRPENEAISGIYAKIEVYTIRLALIIEMMRFACGESHGQQIGIEAVQGAIQLAEYFFRSAVKVHSIISDASPLDKLPADKQNLYNILPDCFTTNEGLQVAESMEIPERSFKRFLSNRDLFSNSKRGKYEKII